MSLFSPMHLYCNNCGKAFVTRAGGEWHTRVCSRSCHRDLKWRETLSILGKDFYPRKLEEDEVEAANAQ
jgi:hypothetical protein